MGEKLYNKYRFATFEDVVGKLSHITKIKSDIDRDSIDHAYCFYGDHGVGKTSMARLVASKLPKCYIDEIPVSVDAGVDKARDIARNVNSIPIGYKTKLIILDELQKASSAFFTSLLKVIEEPPECVYFVACTTDLKKIPANIKSRFTKLEFKSPTMKEMKPYLAAVCKKEGIKTSDEVLRFICKKNNCIPRDCLSDLELIIGVDETSHLDIVGEATTDSKSVGYEIAKMLYRSQWNGIAKELKTISQGDVEGVRRVVLNYSNTMLLNDASENVLKRASDIIADFEDPFFDGGVASLSRRLYDNC